MYPGRYPGIRRRFHQAADCRAEAAVNHRTKFRRQVEDPHHRNCPLLARRSDPGALWVGLDLNLAEQDVPGVRLQANEPEVRCRLSAVGVPFAVR